MANFNNLLRRLLATLPRFTLVMAVGCYREIVCNRVFEERYRLERDDDADGYGIGLSLCRRIITAHYGHIWVDDAIGKKGSCFRFTLPVY